MLRYPKPIIAAVNGAAMGTGASLLLTADVVVAGPNAIFGAPEPQRGLVAGLGRATTGIPHWWLDGTANLLISARDFSPDESTTGRYLSRIGGNRQSLGKSSTMGGTMCTRSSGIAAADQIADQ